MISARSLALTLLGIAALGLSLSAQDQPLPAVEAQAQTQLQTPSQTSASSAPQNATVDDGWHFEMSPYLWFAGTHGIVGVLGREVGVRASAGDLLSHFNFGLMGAAQARHKRFLLNGDLMWIRLSDNAAVPFPGLAATSADVRVGELVWTSKVGYRLSNHEKFKADANVGVRFWHLGQRLSLNPSPLGLSLHASQDWADIVVGGRVEFPMTPKMSLIALGDVGGWNATAKLDYQFAAVVGYKIAPKWTLVAGYRYLFVDYRSGGGIYNMTTTGLLVGANFRIK